MRERKGSYDLGQPLFDLARREARLSGFGSELGLCTDSEIIIVKVAVPKGQLGSVCTEYGFQGSTENSGTGPAFSYRCAPP